MHPSRRSKEHRRSRRSNSYDSRDLQEREDSYDSRELGRREQDYGSRELRKREESFDSRELRKREERYDSRELQERDDSHDSRELWRREQGYGSRVRKREESYGSRELREREEGYDSRELWGREERFSSREFRERELESHIPREDEGAAALEIFEVIFQSSGKMELKEALSRLSSRNKALIRGYGPEMFIRSFCDTLRVERASDRRSQDIIETSMPLKFCSMESEKTGCPDGNTCNNLHLCPYFVKGNCIYKDKCWMSHDIKDPHTMSLLREIRLAGISEVLWMQVLKKVLADTQMERGASIHDTPDICKFYNNIGGCRTGEKCAFLHVCQHFVDGTCKFGDGCKRDHDLLKEKHNRDILGHFGMRAVEPTQLLSILKLGRKRKASAISLTPGTVSSIKKEPQHKADSIAPRKSSPAPKRIKVDTEEGRSPENQSTDICGFFLRGKCNYGRNCMNIHKELPYQWQLQNNGPGWKDLAEDWNIMFEHGYSDASCNTVIFCDEGKPFKTDFDKMIAVAEDTAQAAVPPLRLRRLSTESSADAPPGHVFSTRWLWYWLDERDKWQSYDSPDAGTKPNTTNSKSLEKDFLQGQGQGSHSFSVGRSSYSLSYSKMKQKNMQTQTERAVRRRPEFVAKEKMKEIAKKRKEAIRLSFALQNATSSCVYDDTALPTHWDPMEDKTGYALIDLPSTSPEYTNTEKAFMQTMASSSVEKIERVQNPDLWTAFVQKKGRMTKKAKDVAPKEMPQLFHGTATHVVDAICQQGFDWRMCGKHGTVYGKGSYFARDANYSHRYTDHSLPWSPQPIATDRKMLVARVIIGSSVLGTNSLTRPPPKDPTKPNGDLHDSCVDNILHPSIYVVFDNNQCYPEYLITYK